MEAFDVLVEWTRSPTRKVWDSIHGKVVMIPLEVMRILQVHSERSMKYEIRYHPGKANVVIDALSRKERVKPRRVRAMAMTIQYGVRGMILTAQSEAFKQENGMMRTVVMDEAHASRFARCEVARIYLDEISSKEGILVDQLRFRWMIYFVVLADAAESDGEVKSAGLARSRGLKTSGKLSIHTFSLSKGSLGVVVEVGSLLVLLLDRDKYMIYIAGYKGTKKSVSIFVLNLGIGRISEATVGFHRLELKYKKTKNRQCIDLMRQPTEEEIAKKARISLKGYREVTKVLKPILSLNRKNPVIQREFIAIIILLSANSDPKLVMKGITHGACDYLVKLVRLKELRNSNHGGEGGKEGDCGDPNGKFSRKRKDEDEDFEDNGNEDDESST
ncbi:putative reverse transcriptase domain-containing protein [Tanacetum coccineum]